MILDSIRKKMYLLNRGQSFCDHLYPILKYFEPAQMYLFLFINYIYIYAQKYINNYTNVLLYICTTMLMEAS